jgi:hypothetical protein
MKMSHQAFGGWACCVLPSNFLTSVIILLLITAKIAKILLELVLCLVLCSPSLLTTKIMYF